jgi:hypothetical protein
MCHLWKLTGSIVIITYVLTYLLTYFPTLWSRVLIEKANRFVAIQKIPRILWNRKVYYYYPTGSTTSKEWTTPDSRNTPSHINPGEEGIADAPGNDGNASMPEQVKRPNPWRKMMMIIIVEFFSSQL